MNIPRHHIRRILVLSTGHMSYETLMMLETQDPERWPVHGGKIPYGFYIYAHEENDGSIPPDLWTCCHYAHTNGFEYIQFDGEWDPKYFPNLPAYKHIKGEQP